MTICQRVFGLILGISLISSPVNAAPEAEVLSPSSQWTVNYADDWCRLARNFGTSESTTTLIFDRFGPDQDFRLLLVGKRFSSMGSLKALTIRFGPDEKSQKVFFFAGELGKDKPALIFRGSLRINAPPATDVATPNTPSPPLSPERIAAVRELHVERPSRLPLILVLGSMRAPFAALDKCVNDLLITWGVDPQTYATLSRPVRVKGDAAKWVTNNDYPRDLQLRHIQGLVEFRLNVNAVGEPTACHIQQSSRPHEFDDVVCNLLMKRAHFFPAIDKAGKAVASFFRGTFSFMVN